MNDPVQLLEEMHQHANDLGIDQIISYSRVLSIEPRAMSDDEHDQATRTQLLGLAKKRALDPTVFDTFAPFFLGGEATSSRWDAYDTRMGDSSLQNYAKDFDIGVAYLSGHNTRSESVGRTLTGLYSAAAGKKPATVRSDVYMIQEPSSLTLVSKIRAGIIFDQSIGFYGGQYICTICNRDMATWWTEDGCQHFLGMMYTPLDSKGKAKEGEKVKARATIEGAHVAELSNVYDGATPGAMIDKARSLASQGQMDRETQEFVSVRYKIRVGKHATIHAAAPIETETGQMTEEEIAALRESVLKAERARDAQKQANDVIRAAMEKAGLPADYASRDTSECASYLVGEIQRLRPLADDGNSYREDLIKSALEEGVRALGKDFQTETYKGVLLSMPIEAIKRFRDDYAAIAKRNLPGGRQTNSEADGEQTKPAGAALATGFVPRRVREAQASRG